MASFHTINFPNRFAINNRVIVCPTCGADKALSVFGYMGRPASVRCPKGHENPLPPPFNDPGLIATILSHPDMN
jgi:hypothetical protein